MLAFVLKVIACVLLWVRACNASDGSVRYDRNVNLFSSNGELLQVQYARRAGLKGSPVLCSVAKDNEVVACIPVTSSLQTLQEGRSVDKLTKVCDGIWITFSGLAGDGRALTKAARSFCLQYQAKFGNYPYVRSVAKYIGEIQHECTLSGGRRPFGVQVILIGVEDPSGTISIYNSEPSGEITRWKAIAIGRHSDKYMQILEDELSDIHSTTETARKLSSIVLATTQFNSSQQPINEGTVEETSLHKKDEEEDTEFLSETTDKFKSARIYRFSRQHVPGRAPAVEMQYFPNIDDLVQGVCQEEK